MSATTEAIGSASQKVGSAPAVPLSIRIRVRLHRRRLDAELASGADPNTDPLRHKRAQELVGEECRRKIAASLERLLAEAGSAPRSFTSKVPIARAAIRDTHWGLDTIVERLKAPAYISPRGVAMISMLLCDGAGPLYGNPTKSQVLRRALEATVDAIDHGPVLVG